MKKIPEDVVINRLKIVNTWWNEPYSVPRQFSDLIPRPYIDILYPLISNKKVQRAAVLMGPRRVGKTVILHHVIQRLIEDNVAPEKISYLSVDHPIYNGLDLDNLLDACSRATGVDYREDDCYVFFDEIQYLKNWETYLKLFVDRYPNLKCTVSGSAAAALRLKSIESGAGRFSNFLLPPLAFYEYLHLLGQTGLVEEKAANTGFLTEPSSRDIKKLNEYYIRYLNFGGYPEVALSEEIQKNPGQFVKSDIIDKVLLRDLPSLYGVSDIQELNYLFTTLAYNTANEISLEDLARDSGVAKNTLRRYMEYLEAAFLIKIVHRVDRTARRFKRANFFKVYLTNPSMRAALFNPVTETDETAGQLVETSIFAHWFHIDKVIHYARWNRGEVDLVEIDEKQKARWAIEAKWSDRYPERPAELKSAIAFCHEQNLADIRITTKTVVEKKTYKNVRMDFIPAALYCYMLGYNIIKGKAAYGDRLR